MGIVFKNNAKTTLASSLSNSATSATVTDGSVFPSLSAGEFFLVTFDDGTNNEICKCTARSGNTLTIVRAQESTTARAFSSGDAAEGRVTAGVLETIQENIAAKSANQTVFNTTTSGGATTYNIGTNPGVEANAMVFLNGVLQHHDTLSFSGTNLTFDAAPANGLALEVIIDNLINLQSSNLTVDSFTATDVTGNNTQTDFTLSDTPAAETNLIVFVDGVFQDQDAYTISSNTLTITTGVIAGRGVTVYVINPVNIGTPSDSTVTSAKLSGNITMPGTLTVGSNDVAFDSPTFVVDNANSRVGLGTASPSVPVDIVGEVKTSTHINIGGNLVKASGDLTLDVAGSIILDADNTGLVDFKDGGTHFGRIENASSDFKLESRVQDKDIVLVGNDNGTGVEALRLDMSAAGKALFNSGAAFGGNVDFADNAIIVVGAGDDLQIYHDGSDSYIKDTGTGNLLIQYSDLYFSKDAGSSHSVVFRSTGRVGIGTTGPDTGLHLSGGDNTAAKLTLTNTAPSPDNTWSLHPIYNGQDLLLQEDGTTRVTFTSATAEQTNSGSQPALFLQDTTAGGGAGNGGQIIFKGHHASSSDGFREFAKILGLKQNSTGGDTHGELRFYVNKGAASASEVGRFNHDGDFLVATTIGVGSFYNGVNGVGFGYSPNGYGCMVRAGTAQPLYVSTTGQGSGGFIEMSQNGAVRGIISYNGSVMVYGGTSDYRLKENVTPIENALTKISALKPINFDWKENGANADGFLAHEAQEIVPYAVQGEKDQVYTDENSPEEKKNGEPFYQTMEYGKLTPLLVKAIQEQQDIIDDLKARIEALEG